MTETEMEKSKANFTHVWVRRFARKSSQTILFLSFSFVSTMLYAQFPSQGGNQSESQNGNSVNCSDPSQAGSTECAGQQTDAINSQTPSNTNGSSNLPTFKSNNPNYSDTERLNSQTQGRNQQYLAKPQPEPLTEFQQFIVSTTNQILPIYGASLFSTVPTTFAPVDLAPVPTDYVVGPGDELRIRVWGQIGFQADARVDRSGDIFLPQVGPVHVAGLSFASLDDHLRTAIGRVFQNFSLTVDIGQIRAIQVYVSGQARRPGVYTVSSLSTLVDALFASGGPSLQGSMRHIQLRRGNEVVTDFDLYRLLVNGDKSKDVKLLSGDVIFIPPAGAQVAITGSVRNPAIYEVKSGDTVAKLLADAGGLTSVAAESRISIERVDEHRDRHAMEVGYDETGLSTALSDGDLVRVFSIVPMYRKTVTLRGNIANPGRFEWHAGMHISDLIPDKDSLITRDYWWKRTQLGLPAPEFQSIAGFDSLRQPSENRPITLKPWAMDSRNPQGLLGYQQGQMGNQQGQAGNQQGQSGFSQFDQTGQSGMPQGYQQGQPGYLQNQNQNQNLTADQRASNSSLAGAQTIAGNHLTSQTQRTQVQTDNAEIDWDYAVIERFDTENLKTKFVPFDLGKLVLQHDPSQDLELQPGDVVTIFSDADIRIPLAHQNKSVTLDGEFAHAGVYTALPGETLRDLVERAGGITPNAYLFGSEFTRESTRSIQQARFDEYVRTLGMEIQRGSLAISATASNSAQDLASGLAAQNTEMGLLASLKQVRATGRIVLRFAPNASAVDAVPPIPLEDGDRFAIPPIPATVNVVGAVYDQNSFLYSSGARVGAYLQMAGGPNRNADRKHAFVIRADGEVISYERAKTLWGNGFKDLRLDPGDTIMVPEKTFRPNGLRAFIDWSQIFSQLALGAAALAILK